MILQNSIEIKSKYKNKTKYSFWTDLREGDIVHLSIDISTVRRGSRGLYATNVKIVNLTTGDKFGGSITEIYKYLKNIDYDNKQ